jgi:hypothetical protein
VPPKRLLDRTSSGDEAGDESLRSAVRKSRDKPRVWLCGHIHEGAGACRVRCARCSSTLPREPLVWRDEDEREREPRMSIVRRAGAAWVRRGRFGARQDGATTLVNAANANPGAATRLVSGPIVMDLEVAPAER